MLSIRKNWWRHPGLEGGLAVVHAGAGDGRWPESLGLVGCLREAEPDDPFAGARPRVAIAGLAEIGTVDLAQMRGEVRGVRAVDAVVEFGEGQLDRPRWRPVEPIARASGGAGTRDGPIAGP